MGVRVLAIDRPDAGLIFLEWIDVHHPIENYREERATSGVAGFLRVDRSLQTELRIWTEESLPLFLP